MNITAGKYKGQKVLAPDENITRPTLSKVRMSVFNTLQSLIEFEASSFLDMFSGSGIMALEALSRGFTKIVAIEKNKKAFNIIKNNFKKYQNDNDLKLLLGDSLKLCKNFSNNFENNIGCHSEFISESKKTKMLKQVQHDNAPQVIPSLIQNQNSFDVIYIDPPYFSGVYEESLNAVKNIASGIVILEHVVDVDFSGYEIIKQKKYSDKYITFLQKKS